MSFRSQRCEEFPLSSNLTQWKLSCPNTIDLHNPIMQSVLGVIYIKTMDILFTEA